MNDRAADALCHAPPAPWDTVAAPGTDPDQLADVVGAMSLDEKGTRRAVARLADDDPDLAVHRRFPPTVVDRDPARRAAAAPHARVWAEQGVRVALLGDPGFPPRAAHVPQPPPFLAVRGDLTSLRDRPVVALVGARSATAYGRGVAAWLAEGVAEAGVHVVSGGAVGIDGAAHGAACHLPGGTSVVLGCAHDVPYPRPHARPDGLFASVLSAGGAVLSECLPGTPPRPERVRARNRLVAGLADAVVVVEGGPRSGSLITATAAGERGVTVLAVPGDVRAPGSAAPHRLLVEGALPCTSPTDLLDALGHVQPERPAVADEYDRDGPGPPSVLPPAVRTCLARAWPRPVDLDDLARDADVSMGALLAALTRARVAGEVAQGPTGARLRRDPRPSGADPSRGDTRSGAGRGG